MDFRERAEVDLALVAVVVGDVGQAQLVGSAGGEVAFDEAVVGRRTWSLAVRAAFLASIAPGHHK